MLNFTHMYIDHHSAVNYLGPSHNNVRSLHWPLEEVEDGLSPIGFRNGSCNEHPWCVAREEIKNDYEFWMNSIQIVVFDLLQNSVVQHYAYGGVQQGTICFCGNDTSKIMKTISFNCDIPCFGGLREASVCGGYRANTVFYTGWGKLPNRSNVFQLEAQDQSGTWTLHAAKAAATF